MSKVVDTKAFLAELEADTASQKKQSLVQAEVTAETVKIAKRDYLNLSAAELAQTIKTKISEILQGNSQRYTLADQADAFDQFDHTAMEIQKKEQSIENSYREELQGQKAKEVVELTEMLTQQMAQLTTTKENRAQEISDLYDQVESLRAKEDEFNVMPTNLIWLDESRKTAHDNLD